MLPKDLVPPRTDGLLITWLGRLQFAGGEFLGLYRSEQQKNKKIESIILDNNKQEESPLPLASFRNLQRPNVNPMLNPPTSFSSQLGNPSAIPRENSFLTTTQEPADTISISTDIQELAFINIGSTAVVPEGQLEWTVGQSLEIECPKKFVALLSPSPDCLSWAFQNYSNSVATCDNDNIARFQLINEISEMYLCISPGTCRVKDRIPCGPSTPPKPQSRKNDVGNFSMDFTTCSVKLGCCWDERHQQCYQYSNNFRYGDPYMYLVQPQPLKVRRPTPSPTSPSNNKAADAAKQGFLATTTGKIVVIASGCVVILAIIFAVASHCKSARDGENISSFCLHEFISKRYDVVKELGKGGFGTVYLAIRKSDQKELALKVIACSNEDDVQSALMEFNLLRETKPHPGMMQIIDVHCSWEDEDEKKRQAAKLERLKRKSGMLRSGILSSSDNLAGGVGDAAGSTNSPMRRSASADEHDNDAMNKDPKRAPLLGKSSSTGNLANSAYTDKNGSNSAEQGAKIEQQKFVCIVMEYFSEGDLAHFIAQTFENGGGPNEAWLWTVLAKQLFGALAHLHAQNPPVVHRDIKPENILIASRGNRLVITDFGLAAQYERTFMSTRAGSFHYLAPECWSHRYTASVDVWSAGCILYAAATGCVAPPAARVMFNDARHPSFASEIRDDLRSYSPDFSNLVLSILKMDPNQRPTAAELYESVSRKCSQIVKKGSDDDNSSVVDSHQMTVSEKSNTSVQNK